MPLSGERTVPVKLLLAGMGKLQSEDYAEAKRIFQGVLSASMESVGTALAEKDGGPTVLFFTSLAVYSLALYLNTVVLEKISEGDEQSASFFAVKLSGLVDALNNIIDPLLRRCAERVEGMRADVETLDGLSNFIRDALNKSGVPTF
ncbi:MAG: hypothetical protein DRO06_05155 [Thermoproteota archaeon]|nr:MAG: hypothetical protein DRO06_05155 [Candidatus Korarchaeota archaeon]